MQVSDQTNSSTRNKNEEKEMPKARFCKMFLQTSEMAAINNTKGRKFLRQSWDEYLLNEYIPFFLLLGYLCQSIETF